MYFQVPRFVALRGGDMNEESPATGNEGGALMRHASARALGLRSLLLLEAFSMYPEGIPELRPDMKHLPAHLYP